MADFLKNKYQVRTAHPLEAEKYEDRADLILVRNIWPTMEYTEKFRVMNERFIRKKLKVYNPPVGSGDMAGKEYLIRLWNSRYPVIPTVRNVDGLDSLPMVEKYITKPLYGSNAIGVQILTRSELIHKQIEDCIIQPFLKLKQEISFYFIDGELQFALRTKDPGKRWELMPFQPTLEQIQMAKEFVEWNTLPYGIQRIDFGLTEHDEFLLMEIEDWCPYLSLLEIDEERRSHFLSNLTDALNRIIVTE